MSTNMPASARYEEIRDCGSGAFGVCKLMRDKVTGEMVAVKFMERGEKIDHNVEREIVNHKTLLHPQVIQFKEVFLTQSHLAIALEYASGGELFDTVARAGRLSENDARYFFQQIVVGLEYCHSRGVCHRDLKLENILLDGSPKRRLKICDFGYSKNLFNSAPKSTVGTVAYIAPEVLTCRKDSAQYRGQAADVWSCGVILYVMLVGSYPFEDPADPRNMRKTVEKILDVKYSLPRSLSSSCRDLLKNIFVRDPNARITIPAIKAHPWFQHALPPELQYQGIKEAQAQIKISHQSDDEIKAIIEGAHKRAGEVAPKAAVEEKPEWTNGKEPLEQFSSLDSDFIDDDIESYMMASGIDKSLLYSDDSGIPPQ